MIVDVLHASSAGRDAWGSSSRTYADPVRVDVMVAPRTSSESATAGYENRIIEGLTLFLPPGVQIGARDRVIVNGATYEVDGIPGVWQNGFDGITDGAQVALKLVQG